MFELKKILFGDVFLLFWVIGFASSFMGVLATFKLFRKSKNLSDSEPKLNAVSILKPLKGTDEGLEENLESFFLQDYPKFELLFSVADEKDPAASLVKRLMRRFPNVKSKLFIGSVDAGSNPKVNNMIKSYAASSFDCVLISDSNTRVPRNFVKNIMSQFKDDVALESAIVAGQSADGVSGHLDASFINTFCAKGAALASSLNIPCVTGKAMLFRKKVLDKVGGLQALANEIAEDYIAGQWFHHLGYKVVACYIPVTQIIGKITFKSFWERHLRWGRIRKIYAPFVFFLEPFSTSILSGIFGAIACSKLFHWQPVLFFVAHMLIWYLLDLTLLKKLQKNVSWASFWAWWIGEFIRLPLWVHIAMGNKVRWRGQMLTMQRNSILPTLPSETIRL